MANAPPGVAQPEVTFDGTPLQSSLVTTVQAQVDPAATPPAPAHVVTLGAGPTAAANSGSTQNSLTGGSSSGSSGGWWDPHFTLGGQNYVMPWSQDVGTVEQPMRAYARTGAVAATGTGTGAVTGAASGAAVGGTVGAIAVGVPTGGAGVLPGAGAGALAGAAGGAAGGALSGFIDSLFFSKEDITLQEAAYNGAFDGAVSGLIPGIAGGAVRGVAVPMTVPVASRGVLQLVGGGTVNVIVVQPVTVAVSGAVVKGGAIAAGSGVGLAAYSDQLDNMLFSTGSGGNPVVRKAINSDINHAAERAVERGVFADKKSAADALRDLSKKITEGGFPPGTIPDPKRADSVLVPFGIGHAVYEIKANGTAILRTVLGT